MKSKNNKDKDILLHKFEQLQRDTEQQQYLLRQEISAVTQNSVKNLGSMLAESQQSFAQSQTQKMQAMQEGTATQLAQMEKRIQCKQVLQVCSRKTP
ncbi:MAG: hypothetical protein RR263_05255 [Oscillospiraceae bacterium]